MPKKEKIAANVVTYNRKDLLKECLNSLLAQTRKPDSIVIVDNNSNDGTKEMLEKEFLDNPIFDYVRLNENTGSAGGQYTGIKRAYEKGFDWVWCMDDDVEPQKNCLENLIKYKNLKKAAVLYPLRLWENDKTPFLVEPKKLNLTKPFRKLHLNIITEKDIAKKYLRIEGFTFEGPLIKTEIIKKIGLPDKTKFILYDDTDYAIRIKKLYNIYMVTSAHLFRKIRNHKNSFSWKDYYDFRNRLIIYKDYASIYVKLLKLPVLICFRIVKNAYPFKKLKITIRSIYDAQFNRDKIYLPEEIM